MTTSRTEAEYVVASDAAKEARWLDRLVDMFPQANPNSAPFILNDNQGAVSLAKNLVHHNTSKHIEVQYHFIQDCATKGKPCMEKVALVDKVPNGMTKSLSADCFWSIRQLMGVKMILDWPIRDQPGLQQISAQLR